MDNSNQINCINHKLNNVIKYINDNLCDISGPTGPTGALDSSFGEMYLSQTGSIDMVMLENFYTVSNANCDINKDMIFIEEKVTENINGTDGGSIFIIGKTGTYRVSTIIDGSLSNQNVDISQSIFVNEVEISKTNTSRHYQQSNDDGSVSFAGFLVLNTGDRVNFKFSQTHGSSPTTFNFHNFNLSLNKID